MPTAVSLHPLVTQSLHFEEGSWDRVGALAGVSYIENTSGAIRNQAINHCSLVSPRIHDQHLMGQLRPWV